MHEYIFLTRVWLMERFLACGRLQYRKSQLQNDTSRVCGASNSVRDAWIAVDNFLRYSNAAGSASTNIYSVRWWSAY